MFMLHTIQLFCFLFVYFFVVNIYFDLSLNAMVLEDLLEKYTTEKLLRLFMSPVLLCF